MANGFPYAQSRWMSDAEIEAFDEFDFGSIARALGPVQRQLGAALPGVVQGAQAGSVAGPWGALVGGLAGGALSLATQQRGAPAAPPPASVAPSAPPTSGAPMPAVAPAAVPVATSPGAAPTASGQLAQLLQNPLLHQAVGALASGRGGATAGVPAGAVLNLLGTLANSAAYEAEASYGEADDSYLRGRDGRFVRDPSAPAERAAVVWDRLFPASGMPMPGESLDEAEWFVGQGIAQRF